MPCKEWTELVTSLTMQLQPMALRGWVQFEVECEALVVAAKEVGGVKNGFNHLAAEPAGR